MPEYAYVAADANGSIVKGTRFANSEQELAALVKSSGMHLLESSEAKGSELLKSLQNIQLGGVGRRDLIEFSNNMGVMFRAGVPLINALDELRQDTENRYFQKVLASIIQDIEAGDALYEAMAKRPKVFPTLYTNVIQIGENTGALDSVFFDLSRHYKRIDDLIKNVRKALAYPAFVVVALLLASFVFLVLVFPPLFELLESFKVPLPTITKVVMGVSGAMKDYWYYFLAGLVGFFILFTLAKRNPKTRYYIDFMEINLPGFKGFFVQLRLAFFMRYLAMVLSAGMDILRGLQLATDSVNNLVLRKFLHEARERVIEGEFLSASLKKIRYIPNMVSRMIAIGEEAGNLPDQMSYVADYYNEELERRITLALALMEPILLFCLAGLALALVMGVLLPLYTLVSTLSTAAGSGTGGIF